MTRVTMMIHRGEKLEETDAASGFFTVRELEENQDCLEFQENLDWLVFLDLWDLLDHLDHLDLLDQATEMLDL